MTRMEQKLREFGNFYEQSIATTFKCMINGLIELSFIQNNKGCGRMFTYWGIYHSIIYIEKQDIQLKWK